jgi:hypothetical protein
VDAINAAEKFQLLIKKQRKAELNKITEEDELLKKKIVGLVISNILKKQNLNQNQNQKNLDFIRKDATSHLSNLDELSIMNLKRMNATSDFDIFRSEETPLMSDADAYDTVNEDVSPQNLSAAEDGYFYTAAESSNFVNRSQSIVNDVVNDNGESMVKLFVNGFEVADSTTESKKSTKRAEYTRSRNFSSSSLSGIKVMVNNEEISGYTCDTRSGVELRMQSQYTDADRMPKLLLKNSTTESLSSSLKRNSVVSPSSSTKSTKSSTPTNDRRRSSLLVKQSSMTPDVLVEQKLRHKLSEMDIAIEEKIIEKYIRATKKCALDDDDISIICDEIAKTHSKEVDTTFEESLENCDISTISNYSDASSSIRPEGIMSL